MKIIYNSEVLANTDKCIEKAVSSWQEAQKRTQIALVSILMAQYRHKDGETTIKRCNTLIEGAKAGNQKAIVEWLDRMGFRIDAEGIKAAPDNAVIEARAGRGFADAKALEWWELKPQKPFEGYDLVAAHAALIKKADKMVALAEESPEAAEKINIDPDMLERLRLVA